MKKDQNNQDYCVALDAFKQETSKMNVFKLDPFFKNPMFIAKYDIVGDQIVRRKD